jgi:hypothetical protein
MSTANVLRSKQPVLIPWKEHFMWPWMVMNGFAHQADEMIPRNALARPDTDDLVYIPNLHGIYIFQNMSGNRFCWYAQAEMVSFNNKLYHVVNQHQNLLYGYAWMAKKTSSNNYMLITNLDLTFELNENGYLRINGYQIDRYSGKIHRYFFRGFKAASVSCVQMIPALPWWLDMSYSDKIKDIYAKQDQITSKLVFLQKVLKIYAHKKIARRTLLIKTIKSIAGFSALPDDVSLKIFQMAWPQITNIPRCVQLELSFP